MKLLVFQLFLGISFSFTYSQVAGQNLFVLGIVDEIQSVILSEKRILNIYLPPEYDSKDSTRYAVIYLLDGSVDEDFIHVSGLVQFNTFSWVNRIPKTIVVGIANVDRRRDFTFPTSVLDDQQKYPTAGHSDRFIQFIEKELQPYINSKYRTNASKTIIGESLGGLLATEILLKRPTLFDHYIIISPSLWWNNGSLLNYPGEILEAKYSHPTVIYIGVGKEGLTPSDPPRVMEVDANLLAEKLMNSKSKSVQVYFDYLPAENHATVGHQAIYNAFRNIYPAASN